MGHLNSGECNRDQDRNELCFCGASVLVGDVLMESYTGSRKGGWREPGRCEQSDVGGSHRLAKNKDAGIKRGPRSTIPMG